VNLVEQWRQIERGLPEDWGDARLALTLADERQADRAAAFLGPVNPGRGGKQVRFYLARRGAGPRPELVLRLLRRLDQERIEGRLELAATGKAEPEPPAPTGPRGTLAETWDAAAAGLPSDWSDAYAEIELRSTDHLERAALLLAPVNPARFGGKPAFRFRVARRFGYGASPQMTRRSLERLDEEGIRGTVRILWAVSDSRPVATQGPVWYVGGKVV
jgi:hypothetical protein